MTDLMNSHSTMPCRSGGWIPDPADLEQTRVRADLLETS